MQGITGAAQAGGLAADAGAQNQRTGAGRGGFDAALQRAQRGGTTNITMPGQGTQAGAADASQEERLRSKAEEMISMALVKPVLKQMRGSENAAEPFKPGAWEKQFAPMLDARWAKSIVSSENWDLVDAVARGLLKNGSGASDAAAKGDRDGDNHEQNG